MNIQPILGHGSLEQIRTIAPQAAPRPLTNEITAEQLFQPRHAFSGEGRNLSELIQMYPEYFQSERINLPGRALHEVEQTLLLMRTMRTARVESGEMTLGAPVHPFNAPRPFDLSELAAAYNHIAETTNSGNRHLDNAFNNIANMILTNSATAEGREEASRRASLFSETFLNNLRRHGLEDALGMALAAI
ncbi:MAG: hypothetical protein LBE35_07260 [Clostridiales bacterium]|jgi:hypothetical protein|nr:hypothetical protein [Clostridiales bacterium]